MEKFFAEKGASPNKLAAFKIALHVLDWVLEKNTSADFTIKANQLVATGKARVRKRATPKRVVTADHFAI